MKFITATAQVLDNSGNPARGQYPANLYVNPAHIVAIVGERVILSKPVFNSLTGHEYNSIKISTSEIQKLL